MAQAVLVLDNAIQNYAWGSRTAIANLLLAGDAAMHPSIEGAVSSGRRAARIVQGMLG